MEVGTHAPTASPSTVIRLWNTVSNNTGWMQCFPRVFAATSNTSPTSHTPSSRPTATWRSDWNCGPNCNPCTPIRWYSASTFTAAVHSRAASSAAAHSASHHSAGSGCA